MDLLDENGDAFDVRIFWKPSAFSQNADITFSELFPQPVLELPQIKIENHYAPTKGLDSELLLPDLENFKYGALEEPESTIDPTILSVKSGLTGGNAEQLDNLWNDAASLGPLDQGVEFFTWESFEDQGHEERTATYISEAGTKVFDSAISRNSLSGKPTESKLIKPSLVLGALFNLGLGRSSPLFVFDDKQQTFNQTVKDGRIPGCSLLLCRDITQQFIQGGNAFKYLRSFVVKVYQSSKSISSRIALANSVTTVLSVMESQLELRSADTLLQLQKLFQKPHQILGYIQEIIKVTQSTTSNEDLATNLYKFAESKEQQDDQARAIILQILSRVADPWLQHVAEWIGLDHERSPGLPQRMPSFVEFVPASGDGISGPQVDEYVFNAAMMPPFIPDEDARVMFETGNAVRFLRTHHPRHPLSLPQASDLHTPKLEWKFSWSDLEAIEQKAKVYEQNLRAALVETWQQGKSLAIEQPDAPATSAPVPDAEWEDDSTLDPERYILESMKTLNLLPSTDLSISHDDLHHFLVDALQKDNSSTTSLTFAPPTSLTPSLSLTPIIMAQARLVNAATLRLFLHSHSIRHHLSLQRQYQLLGDGVFVARLSSALFSPDLATAERQRGVVRTGSTMGLRLGSRTNWPPASSELRLALMGVLSDCYYSSPLYFSTASPNDNADSISGSRENPDLPGQLSFAVRTLPEEEVEKLMDPRSLYALDFLRLQYIPPPPLHLVITSGALEKYDDIFKLLLRLLRMLYVVNHLPHNDSIIARSLRFEATHFVRSITSYFFEIGIRCKWDDFSHFLDSTESRLVQEDKSCEPGTIVREGLDSLREAHERCLDRIMYTLFLRKRHAKVMLLLEEIFDCILRFANVLESDLQPMRHVLEELRASFSTKLDVFLKVCKGLSGKKAKGGASGSGDEDDIDRFLVLMEMNGYDIQ